jgi:hypothetical protein
MTVEGITYWLALGAFGLVLAVAAWDAWESRR